MAEIPRYNVGGEMLTIRQMAFRANVTKQAIFQRLKNGMTPEEACRPPTSERRYNVNGESLTLQEMASRTGLTREGMQHRLRTMEMEPGEAMRYAYREPVYNLMGAPMPVIEIAEALGCCSNAIYARAKKHRTDIQTEIDAATITAILRGKLKRRPGWLPDKLREADQ